MNVEVTKDELLAVVAVYGYVGGESKVRKSLKTLVDKIVPELNMVGVDYSHRKAEKLLNSENRNKQCIFFFERNPIENEPSSFATLTFNNNRS